jgi:hypothetical protein
MKKIEDSFLGDNTREEIGSRLIGRAIKEVVLERGRAILRFENGESVEFETAVFLNKRYFANG